MIVGHPYHDDIQGILQTAHVGVTQYTMREYRSTGVVMPHVAEGDIFSLNLQMPHRKKLATACDSVHIHYIPVAAADGDIKINFAWGWYNPADGSTIPATLPNTGSKVITLVAADQYKLKIAALIENLTQPTDEGYSSILLVKCTRATPSGTNWGASNEIALVYVDAHYQVDRYGSYAEYNDS